MDDNDVCPLCCEELDISDRQFFPCKCGYQVCMWCWHKIRESESGLCPACRNPYGDDPHEFSAVDMEQVLKENKAKAAAEKRERERLKEDGEVGGGAGPMALPKDRNQLANMRVIRRNLVYAVGLPPAIATEEILRKADYFGQYGKISKIVLNRSNTTSADPRRASASAYVTFVHKEDTLACILALDGFYIDGRNIRASYGTSKYCSAFIKNVRCNNPECTYLHCMGDAEDTFTKQEIQAGYVTSGRDVLARQQQIVAQALSAAAGGAGGSGGETRRKVGGGGPSGTGKAASNPQFPPPSYDEPIKPPAHTRSSSGSGGFAPAIPSSTMGSKVGRSISLGAGTTSIGGMTAAAVPKGAIGAASTGFPATRSKSVENATTLVAPPNSVPAGAPIGGSSATAAAVVAAGRNSGSVGSEVPSSHSTLTALTPLKRSSTLPSSKNPAGGLKTSGSGELVDAVQLPPNMPVPKGLSAEQRAALLEQRREAMATMARQQHEMALKLSALRSNGGGQKQQNGVLGTAPVSPSPSISSNNNMAPTGHDIGTIGGTAIGPAPGLPGGFGDSLGGLGGLGGGQPIGDVGAARSSSLGGEIYTGQLPTAGAPPGNGGVFGNNTTRSDGLWGGDVPVESGFPSSGLGGRGSTPGVIGGGSNGVGAIGSHGPIGGGNVIGGSRYNSGSSALASMLGINLPSGSDSLRESSSSLWESSAPAAPIGNPSGPGVIGGSSVIGTKSSVAPIGGYAIGGGGGGVSSGGVRPPSNPIGGGSGNSNNSDIALLQSLLPGVHITSGNAQQPAAPTSGFGAVGGSGWDGGTNNTFSQGNNNSNTWGQGGMQQPQQQQQPSRVGAPGVGSSQQNQKRNPSSSSIW